MAEDGHRRSGEGASPGGGSDVGGSPSSVKALSSWDTAAEFFNYYSSMKDYVDSLVADSVGQHVHRIAATCPSPIVLDVAGGTGWCAIKVAQRFPQAQITATDFSSAMVEFMKRNIKEAGVANIVAKVMDGQDMKEVGDGSVDVLTCNFGINCFQDRARGWREIQRVLRPGGRAVVVTWMTMSPHLLSQEALAKYDEEEKRRGVDVGVDEKKRRAEAMERLMHMIMGLPSREAVTADLASAGCHFSSVEFYEVRHLWEDMPEGDIEKVTSSRGPYFCGVSPGFKDIVAGRDMQLVMSKLDEVMRSRLNEKRKVAVPWKELFTILTK
ncbi:hypothetical protein CBR_g45393 [Chara braunii]|uniref:Methyltransferase domain-containing protein n=1 Tax=Chara braunii TaxID=69332 RepID=A0A388LYJ6_CHABU|nr:hypothetical protein CBR_g45393 [Chara braunii]|eukprot:GBG87333.1 hypothetical protein CBR_g45393 [Chara braunii]